VEIYSIIIGYSRLTAKPGFLHLFVEFNIGRRLQRWTKMFTMCHMSEQPPRFHVRYGCIFASFFHLVVFCFSGVLLVVCLN
jgi:hypothetical protein